MPPTYRGKHQICEANAVTGSGRTRQVPWASSSLKSDSGPSLSQAGRRSHQHSLGNRFSSTKNGRETSLGEKPKLRGERVGR